MTGTSVVALKYADGILMAADMGGSHISALFNLYLLPLLVILQIYQHMYDVCLDFA